MKYPQCIRESGLFTTIKSESFGEIVPPDMQYWIKQDPTSMEIITFLEFCMATTYPGHITSINAEELSELIAHFGADNMFVMQFQVLKYIMDSMEATPDGMLADIIRCPNKATLII